MHRSLKITLASVVVAVVASILVYLYLPINRIGITSELIMLGDLNGDNKWDNKDENKLSSILANPFAYDCLTQLKIDVNKNGLIDAEDLKFLKHMYKFSNPYLAKQKADEQGMYYPTPREFFKYLSKYEYVQRPLYSLSHAIIKKSPFTFLKDFKLDPNTTPYERQLLQEIYNEALRFSFVYDLRANHLTKIEKDYVEKKLQYCNDLFAQKEYFSLLLNLITLTEDAETLTTKGQSDFIKKLLYFRDHLKELLVSKEFTLFKRGETPYSSIYKKTIPNS